MYNINYLLNSILQLTITVFLWHQIGKPKFSYFKTIIFPLIAINIIHILNWEKVISDTPDKLLRTLTMLVIPFIGYKDKLPKKIVMMMLYFIPGLILEQAVYNAMLIVFGNLSEELLVEDNALSFGMMLLSDLMLTCFIFISCIWKRKDIAFRKNITYLVIMSVFMLIHALSLIIYYSDNTVLENDSNNIIQLIYQTLLIILTFIQYYNMLHHQRLLKSEEDLKHLESEMEHIYSYYRLAEEKFNEISGLRHDMQNQIAAVKQLISEDKNTDKAQDIIDKIQEKLSAAEKKCYCENPIINSVLTIKTDHISEYGINTEIMLNDCDELPFEDYDLCSLFANLLDNAFEVCKKSTADNKFIDIKSGIKEKYFILKIRNNCAEAPSLHYDDHDVPDNNRSHNNINNNIIETIVQKYDGNFHIEYDSHTMTSVIVLSVNLNL